MRDEEDAGVPGLLSAMEGFFIIGVVIAVGYVAARFHVGGPTAQLVLNKYSFFVSTPCLMFAILSKQKLSVIFHPSIIVAFLSAAAVGLLFVALNATSFHLPAAEATIGALDSLYLNSNNIGLPVATYSGQSHTGGPYPGHATGPLHPNRADRSGRDHLWQAFGQDHPQTAPEAADPHRLHRWHSDIGH